MLATRLATSLAASPDHNLSFPAATFAQLRAEGLLHAPLLDQWGIAPGTHAKTLDTLRYVGSLDLAAGRLYEGHVNALMLISKFGNPAAAEQDLNEGCLFGVWNTDSPAPVTATREGAGIRFEGRKAFGSGAGTITRPIVTAEFANEGRIMCLLPLDTTHHTIDYTSWHPLGMEASDSFTVDFTGAQAPTSVILGNPGDYYRQPAFSGGAIRFAAVQFGAVERLAQSFTEWLQRSQRTTDPYQLTRAGEIEISVESGRQWIARAAAEAEQNFNASDQPAITSMVHTANMTRLAIERICLDVMERVTRGIGARGLLAPATFSKQLRDLSMYLRQPAPDQALAEVGRQALL